MKNVARSIAPLLFTALGLASFGTASVGCNVDETVADEADLTAAGKKLIGAHVATATPPSGAHFVGLVLSSTSVTPNANRFAAEIDTGIRCITTPCPSIIHVTGRFTAGSKTITLTADPGQDGLASKLMGKFDYKRTSTKVTLSRAGFKQILANADSFCSDDTAEEDCSLQGLDSSCPDTVKWSCADHACVAACDDPGKFCGGIAGIACPPGLFCRHLDGTCNVADGSGTCMPIPKCNPTYMDPVCSCDGTTYANGCMASAADAQIDHVGACTP